MSTLHLQPMARRCSPPSGPRARRLAVLGAVLATLAILSPARGFAAADPVEYQVKSGFLFNFAKFVEWPTDTLAPGAAVRLGVFAPDDVFQLITKSLVGKVAGDRPLVVERLTTAQLEKGDALPHIIFVHQDAYRAAAEPGLTPQMIAALAEKHPVLIVGESAGFATSGGMIGFVQRGENLRFQVNLASAQRAGLKLSARLAGLAEIVAAAKP
ncbi:MAG: YfiR family protein [Opitutaceae bacterium]|nr:YfiR family protein [Opitutaceae bacterium]